jgi:phosphatidylserine decarboxylase
VAGVVTGISEERNPFLNRRSHRVTLRQSRLGEFNVHSPVEGKVQRRWWPGKEGVEEGVPQDCFAVWVQTDEGDDLVFAVGITGGFRYLRCGVQSGERLGQGRRCGFIGFGRPVDIYLPESSRVKVAVGQRVRAGSDIIGILIHKRNDRS